MISRVGGHRTAERRSLAYHRVIADRLAHDPSLLAAARTRAASWNVHPRYADAWREILAGSPAEVAAVLVEESER
jgi:hypothetical protein